MNDSVAKTLRQIIELHSLEDILNTFSQQKVKTTEVNAQIGSLRAQIPERLLHQHDSLRHRGKRSIAEIRNGVCSGCHMQLATGLLPAVRRGNALLNCENCGRLLYLAPENPPQTDVQLTPAPVRTVKPPKIRSRKPAAVTA
jgi:predicted  nucleic acid-binding Zn-ribbon protein